MYVAILLGLCFMMMFRNSLAFKWCVKANSYWHEEAQQYLTFLKKEIPNLEMAQFELLIEESKKFQQIFDTIFPKQYTILFLVSEWSYETVSKDYREQLGKFKVDLYKTTNNFLNKQE